MILPALALAVVLFLVLKKSPEKKTANAEDIKNEMAEVTNRILTKSGNGDFPGIIFRESPNKSSRGGAKASTLVWHYTAGAKASGAISWLCNPEAKASAHFVIDRDGTITQLVRLADSAWHTGNASLPNNKTIGVEVVNPGTLTQDGGKWKMDNDSYWTPDMQPKKAGLRWPNGETITAFWVPYTKPQVEAMKRLCALIKTTPFASVLDDQCGHEDIATPQGRKKDPGPLFPWDEVSTFDQRKRLHKTNMEGIV